MNPKAREAKRIRRIAKIKVEIKALLHRDLDSRGYTQYGLFQELHHNHRNTIVAVNELVAEGKVIRIASYEVYTTGFTYLDKKLGS